MSNRNFKFPLIVIAAILGVGIFKDFNFNTLSFQDPWLDAIYLITLICVLLIIFKKSSSKNSKNAE